VIASSSYVRPEARALLKLGLPMVATQLFIMAMGFLDTAMAGHYSSTDLAGVALGGNVLWPVFMLMTGLTMAVTPIVAQLRGANNVGDAGAPLRQGLWIALATSLLTAVIVSNAEGLFRVAGVDDEVARVAMGYLRSAAWGLPPAMVYVCLRFGSEGLGHTRPPMVVAALALPINAVANYIFIFGKFGAPELGGVGCGWATAMVWWVELMMMMWVIRRPYYRATGLLTRFNWPRLREIGSILKVGIPIGITMFVEMAVYSVIGFLIARIGVTELAAHSIAGNLNWMTYVIPMSLGSAASIRVGFYVGARNTQGARQAAATAFFISLGYALLVSALLVLLRLHLVGIYTNDVAVIAVAANLMIFIAAYQIVDDTQATMVGALRGYKDTRVPMLYSLFGYWLIALPLGVVLASGLLPLPPLGVYGYWGAMTFGLLLVALMVGVRLWRTSRNDSRIARLAAG
jgi:MATE family multidrug resistance protein